MNFDQFRSEGDPLADSVIEVVQKESPAIWNSEQWKNFISNSDKPDGSWPQQLLLFISESERLPSWSREPNMERAQDFFVARRPLIFLCLGFYSLPYCYAAAKGAKVLYHSKRLREAPGKRLSETATFILDVCEPGAFGHRGKGFRSIMKVRLMHALTRFYLKNQTFWQSDWGLPINQEDMAGTNLAFSLIVLRGLRKLGVDVRNTETEDFLHYWRVIGHLLGVDEVLQTKSVKAALSLERKIISRNFASSEEGIALTASLYKHIESEMTGKSIVIPVKALMRFLLGEPLSKLLKVEASTAEKLVSTALIGSLKWQQLLGVDFFWQKAEIERVNL